MVTFFNGRDCDGPRAAGVATTTSATAAAAEDEETATPTFPPPTESVGCVAHGDHYDCEGPATAAQATTPPTATGAVGTSNGTTADTEDPPVVPFEGGATNMRVMSAIGMTGLVGIIALFVL
ncbi:MAG: hypothetical protein LQ337_008370 [Flavoplaca oasis]|nr:MAG: hypothetical protein LQ337_008370 [Flavoplaca oasis]